MPLPVGHLVGAHGLFWERSEVDWHGEDGAFQLLGRRYNQKPALRVCDFRKAKGVYVLYGDYGPLYVGIARGTGGLGQRLRTHNKKPPRNAPWTRFSWFAFDDVVDVSADGWSEVQTRQRPVPTDSEAVVREVEAMLISLLGTTQSKMKFLQAGARWEQLMPWEAAQYKRKKVVDPARLSINEHFYA